MTMARSRDGNATVELALVLPILLLMLVGILDLARAVNAYVTVRNAGVEGAQWAAVHPDATVDEIADAVRGRVVPLDASLVTVTVDIDDGSGWRPWPSGGLTVSHPARPIPVLVEVSYPWSAVTVIASFFANGSGATFSARGMADALR